MIDFINNFDGIKSFKTFVIWLILSIIIFSSYIFIFHYFENKNKIEEFKRIEEENKAFHEENIQKLKTTLNNAKNAKKIDYNDSGNLDDDYLLKALE